MWPHANKRSSRPGGSSRADMRQPHKIYRFIENVQLPLGSSIEGTVFQEVFFILFSTAWHELPAGTCCRVCQTLPSTLFRLIFLDGTPLLMYPLYYISLFSFFLEGMKETGSACLTLIFNSTFFRELGIKKYKKNGNKKGSFPKFLTYATRLLLKIGTIQRQNPSLTMLSERTFSSVITSKIFMNNKIFRSVK